MLPVSQNQNIKGFCLVSFLVSLMMGAGNSKGDDRPPTSRVFAVSVNSDAFGQNTTVAEENSPRTDRSPREGVKNILENLEGNPFVFHGDNQRTFSFSIGSRSYYISEKYNWNGEASLCYLRSPPNKELFYLDIGCDQVLDGMLRDGGDGSVPNDKNREDFHEVVAEMEMIIPIARQYQPRKSFQEPGHVARLGYVFSNGELLERVGELIRSTNLVYTSSDKYEFMFGNSENLVYFFAIFESGYNIACSVKVFTNNGNDEKMYYDHDCNGSLDYIITNDDSPVRVRDLNYPLLYQTLLTEVISFLQIAAKVDFKS